MDDYNNRNHQSRVRCCSELFSIRCERHRIEDCFRSLQWDITLVKFGLANTIPNTLSATGLTSPNITVTGISTDQPTVDITNGATAAICLGATVTLTTAVTGDPTITYSWTSSPAGFTSTIANPIVSPLVATTYTVTVTDGNGFTATDFIDVTVNPLPTATIAGPATVCQNAASPNVTFTGASGTAPIFLLTR